MWYTRGAGKFCSQHKTTLEAVLTTPSFTPKLKTFRLKVHHTCVGKPYSETWCLVSLGLLYSIKLSLKDRNMSEMSTSHRPQQQMQNLLDLDPRFGVKDLHTFLEITHVFSLSLLHSQISCQISNQVIQSLYKATSTRERNAKFIYSPMNAIILSLKSTSHQPFITSLWLMTKVYSYPCCTQARPQTV